MSENNESVNSILNVAFCNTTNDDSGLAQMRPTNNADQESTSHSARKEDAQTDDNLMLQPLFTLEEPEKKLFIERNKFLSSIKRLPLVDILSDSDLNDLNSLCFLMDHKDQDNIFKKAPKKTFTVNPKTGSKRMRMIIEDDDSALGLSDLQIQDEAMIQNKNQLNGILPNLPDSMSSENIRILDFKSQDDQSGINLTHDSCPICLVSFLKSEKRKLVMLEPCQHILCKICMLEWAKKYKSNCPICRQDFKNLWPLEWLSETELEKGETPLVFTPNSKEWDINDDDFYYERDGSDDNCQVCHRGINFRLMLICDECNLCVCHTYCDPALKGNRIPENDWFCLNCRSSRYNISKVVQQKEQRTNRQRIRQRQQQNQFIDDQQISFDNFLSYRQRNIQNTNPNQPKRQQIGQFIDDKQWQEKQLDIQDFASDSYRNMLNQNKNHSRQQQKTQFCEEKQSTEQLNIEDFSNNSLRNAFNKNQNQARQQQFNNKQQNQFIKVIESPGQLLTIDNYANANQKNQKKNVNSNQTRQLQQVQHVHFQDDLQTEEQHLDLENYAFAGHNNPEARTRKSQYINRRQFI